MTLLFSTCLCWKESLGTIQNCPAVYFTKENVWGRWLAIWGTCISLSLRSLKPMQSTSPLVHNSLISILWVKDPGRIDNITKKRYSAQRELVIHCLRMIYTRLSFKTSPLIYFAKIVSQQWQRIKFFKKKLFPNPGYYFTHVNPAYQAFTTVNEYFQAFKSFWNL